MHKQICSMHSYKPQKSVSLGFLKSFTFTFSSYPCTRQKSYFTEKIKRTKIAT